MQTVCKLVTLFSLINGAPKKYVQNQVMRFFLKATKTQTIPLGGLPKLLVFYEEKSFLTFMESTVNQSLGRTQILTPI